MKITLASRIRELPPYLFAHIDALKAEQRKKGADLIDLASLDPSLDARFRAWLEEEIRFDYSGGGGGGSVISIHEKKPNNFGTHAGATRIAAALYLGDEEELKPPVGGDAGHRLLQRGEPALLHRETVEEDDVEDDPADREQPERHAIGGSARGQIRRHAEEEDGDAEGQDQGQNGRDMGLHFAAGDHAEQGDDR